MVLSVSYTHLDVYKRQVEMFDSSIGAASVYMPYGGKNQLTPTQTMVAKLPVLSGKCDTVTMIDVYKRQCILYGGFQ